MYVMPYNGNGGIVPPWLDPGYIGIYPPIPVEPDNPRIHAFIPDDWFRCGRDQCYKGCEMIGG